MPDASAGAGAPSIVAVLPLTARGGGEDLAMLAEDLTEDVTRDLARSQYFKVIAASTMAAWRGKPVDIPTLAKDTKAKYLIEGKVRQAGGEIGVTLQIVDTETASVISSHRMSRDPDAIGAAPEEFAFDVASELRDRIEHFEFSRCMTRQGPLSGWEHVLRAGSLGGGGPGSMQASVEEARKGVLLAPGISLAHATLAAMIAASDTMIGQDKLGEEARRELHFHIQRALLLDGDNPGVLLYLINAYGVLGDCEAGLQLALRATEIDPNSPWTLFALARAWHMMGRMPEAIAAFERLLGRKQRRSTDNVAGQLMFGVALCIEGRLEEAEAAADRSLALHPHFTAALVLKAVVAVLLGKEQAARSMVLQLREVAPELGVDQHLRFILTYPLLLERAGVFVSTFRRLWVESGGGG